MPRIGEARRSAQRRRILDAAMACFERSGLDKASMHDIVDESGMSVGAIYRYYSGYPINETIGQDVNGDRDNNDRPVSGVHDATRPIVSELDENGRAVRNGIDGESSKLLDLQVQYIFDMPQRQTLGLFWETYNALNWINYGNPTGNRNSSRFLVPDEAGPMRSMQLGVRYTF